MCTCITFENGDFYFGRNLDLEYSFGEQIVVTPRNFHLQFRHAPDQAAHYAMIGMASSAGMTTAGKKSGGGTSPFPLYAEAVNEKGLCMAGLNFPGSACYRKPAEGGRNLASFELIPWILGTCGTVREAQEQLRTLNITDDAFSADMPPAPLHWMLADREQCLVLEQMEGGLKIYENPVGVLTNNPPFEYHSTNLNNYLNLTSGPPVPRFSGGRDPETEMEKKTLRLAPYSQGMGALGLPGDPSSASRFIRAAFLKWNSVCAQDEMSNVSQFFHILDGVAMTRGSVYTEEGRCDITVYSCCVNVRTGVYYYRTYENSQINAVRLENAGTDGEKLIGYGLETEQNIKWQNESVEKEKCMEYNLNQTGPSGGNGRPKKET